MGTKAQKVMREFKRGTLRSGSKDPVLSRDQAIAIAMSEQRKADKRKRGKKKRGS